MPASAVFGQCWNRTEKELPQKGAKSTKRMGNKSTEIICAACGAETFVKLKPKYEGFMKVGERFVCVSCGHEFASEKDVPFKKKKAADVFTADDASEKIEVFTENEKERNCRHCNYYVINPFAQRCGLHQSEVEATNICNDFVKRQDGSAQPTEG